MTTQDANAAAAAQSRFFVRLLPFLPLMAVLAALVYANTCRRFDFHDAFFSSVDSDEWGWPGTFLVKVQTTNPLVDGTTRITHQDQWDMRSFVIDFVLALILAATTVFVCWLWQRRRLRWWQFNLSSLIVLPCIVTIMAAVYFAAANQTFGNWAFDDGSWNGLPWWVVAALLWGIGCAVYTLGWFMWRLVARFFGWRKHLSNSQDEIHVAQT
jgi:hypothetical protein